MRAQTSTFHSQLHEREGSSDEGQQRGVRERGARRKDAPLGEVAHERVVEDRLEPALDVDRLVHHLLAQGRDRLLVDRLLEQLRQLLNRALEVGLVVLEDARLVVVLEAGGRKEEGRGARRSSASSRLEARVEAGEVKSNTH